MNQPVKGALGAVLAVFAAAVLVTSATAAHARHASVTLTFCSDITYPPEEFFQGTKPAGSDIDIGNAGVAAESNTIRVGTSGTETATFIAGIRGVGVAGGQPVAVNANGQLGIRASSARFKEAIKPMNNASEAILALQPVVFRYKKELDAEGVPQFGLVAEQVAKVNPDLVARDDQGKPFTVRYDEVNAMLLNEFLKEHKAFLEEQSTVEELKKQVATLTAGLQKVSAQLEATKPAPQVVNNP